MGWRRVGENQLKCYYVILVSKLSAGRLLYGKNNEGRERRIG